MRKRDLVKIAIENQEILKRIENKRSAYNIRTWQKNREASEKYLQNISEYPLVIGGSGEFERGQVKTADFWSRRNKLPSLNQGFIGFLIGFNEGFRREQASDVLEQEPQDHYL